MCFRYVFSNLADVIRLKYSMNKLMMVIFARIVVKIEFIQTDKHMDKSKKMQPSTSPKVKLSSKEQFQFHEAAYVELCVYSYLPSLAAVGENRREKQEQSSGASHSDT